MRSSKESKTPGTAATGRLFIASDVRVRVSADGRVFADHSSLSSRTLIRYVATGMECILVARSTQALTESDEPGGESLGIQLHALRDEPKARSMSRRAWNLGRDLMRVKVSRRDVVVVRLPELVSSLLWFRARLSGARVIANVVASSDALVPILGRFGRAARWPLRIVLRLMVRTSHGVVYVTRHALQAEYPARVPALSVSNVQLDEGAFAEGPRVYTDPAPGRVRLVAVGSQENLTKGHDLLIDALGILARSGLDARLELVGDGAHQQALRARAAEAGMADRVTFHGFVREPRHVRTIIDGCDYFVMPSRNEGLPRAMIEAMARGICCVGADVGGIPELAPEDALFSPESADAIATCLRRLLEAPEVATSICAAEFHVAHEIFEGTDPKRFAAFVTEIRRGIGA